MKPSNESHPSDNSLLNTLKGYSLCGLTGFGLLALIEWVDTSFRPGIFESFSDRLVFFTYYGIDLLVGAGIGLVIGACAYLAWILSGTIRRLVGPMVPSTTIQTLAISTVLAAASAILLNQYALVHSYIIGVIREVEKFQIFRNPLLNHERASSYLLLLAIVMGCGFIILAVRLVGTMNRFLQTAWLATLLLLILGAYYIDSRVQLQLYEFTLHRTLFLFEVVVAMTLVGSIYSSRQGRNSRGKPLARRGLIIAGLVCLVAAAGFTFVRFDSNQSLKTAAFYQTTQMKQSFRLARWALDFDRDGYSSLLGGGDAADTDARVNPGRPEIPADGLDNNCIGGDITQPQIEEWKTAQRGAPRTAMARSGKPFNVVYFFIDALRADHLGAYGYTRPTSPNLDRLAARGQVFENAFTPAPRTAAAVPKFMQSSYWDGHLDSWTEMLSGNGYDTMLFPGRRSWERYKKWMPVVPTAQGKALKENIDVAIETLEARGKDQPFCAYIYVPDPHKPYLPHDEQSFGSSNTDLYDGEIAYTDFHIGRFLDWLERAGRMKDTMVVIMSDHGESLGERGVFLHATQLYNEQARVPLIVYMPGYSPRRIPAYVTTVDLGTTILDMAGVRPPEQYIGVSLIPLMLGEPFVHPPIYGEQTGEEISQFVRFDQQVHPETKKYMVITQDGFKLIYNRDFYTFELYDLRNDPLEAHNLYDRLPDRARETRQLLGRFIDVLSVSRPADADEGRYSRSGETDGDRVEE